MMNILKIDRKNFLIFLIGLFSATQIRIIGAFPLSEFITVLAGLFLFPKIPEYICCKRFRSIAVLLLLWLLNAFISDIYNDTSTVNVNKGLGNIVLFGIDIVFSFWILKDNYYRIVWFVIGAFLSSFLQMYMFPSYTFKEQIAENGLQGFWDVWAVYFIAPVVLIISFLYYYPYRKIVISLILIYAIYSVFNMSRNQFLIYSLVGLLLIVIGEVKTIRKGVVKQTILQKRVFCYVLLMLLGLIIVKFSYEYLAGNNYLGEAAFRKYEMQKFESKMGLASGRGEFWVGLYAIKDSPIIGFGSFAKSDKNYALKFLQEYDPDNIRATNNFRGETTIPAHSHIITAWLWHGLFGLLFWLYIFYLCLLFLWKYILKDPPLIAFSLLMIFIFLWNIFFSPFADRIGTAMRISFILYSMQSIDKLNKLYKKIC